MRPAIWGAAAGGRLRSLVLVDLQRVDADAVAEWGQRFQQLALGTDRLNQCDAFASQWMAAASRSFMAHVHLAAALAHPLRRPSPNLQTPAAQRLRLCAAITPLKKHVTLMPAPSCKAS